MMDAIVITRNPKRLQCAGIIVSIGQKRFSAHMTAAKISIQKGGGTQEPCIGPEKWALEPSRIISERVMVKKIALRHREREAGCGLATDFQETAFFKGPMS